MVREKYLMMVTGIDSGCPATVPSVIRPVGTFGQDFWGLRVLPRRTIIKYFENKKAVKSDPGERIKVCDFDYPIRGRDQA